MTKYSGLKYAVEIELQISAQGIFWEAKNVLLACMKIEQV